MCIHAGGAWSSQYESVASFLALRKSGSAHCASRRLIDAMRAKPSEPIGAHTSTPSHQSACAPQRIAPYAARRASESDATSAHASRLTAIVIALDALAAAAARAAS